MVLEPPLARPTSLGSLAGAGLGAARRRSVIMITGTKRQASKQQARHFFKLQFRRLALKSPH